MLLTVHNSPSLLALFCKSLGHYLHNFATPTQRQTGLLLTHSVSSSGIRIPRKGSSQPCCLRCPRAERPPGHTIAVFAPQSEHTCPPGHSGRPDHTAVYIIFAGVSLRSLRLTPTHIYGEGVPLTIMFVCCNILSLSSAFTPVLVSEYAVALTREYFLEQWTKSTAHSLNTRYGRDVPHITKQGNGQTITF